MLHESSNLICSPAELQSPKIDPKLKTTQILSHTVDDTVIYMDLGDVLESQRGNAAKESEILITHYKLDGSFSLGCCAGNIYRCAIKWAEKKLFIVSSTGASLAVLEAITGELCH